MYLREILITGLLFSQAYGGAYAQESPSLGEPVSDDYLANFDFTILPDGQGLPSGKGDVAAGLVVYSQYCQACHGESGKGGINDALVGGLGSLASEQPVKTIGSYWPYAPTVFDYIRRAMPYPSPGTLSDEETYAVTAYLLYLNGIIDRDKIIDRRTLSAIRMPNQDGFDRAYPPAD